MTKRQIIQRKRNPVYTADSQDKVAKESHKVGLIATLAEKTKRLAEKSVKLVAEKKGRSVQNTQRVVQHLLLVEQKVKAKNGVRKARDET